MKLPSAGGRLPFVVLLFSQLAATTGFMFVIPFMPLYVEQLGVEDPGHAAAWAGLLDAAPAVTMALAAPLWGRLGDRVGQKKMLLRATLAGSVMLGLMGLVTGPWQLLLLRLLQGADGDRRGSDGAGLGYCPAGEGSVQARCPPDVHLHRLRYRPVHGRHLR